MVKVSYERLPILLKMAHDILAVPISTVASESAFSVDGRVLDASRSSLTPKIIEALICGQDWLRSSRHPICVEEKLEDLENFEKGSCKIILILLVLVISYLLTHILLSDLSNLGIGGVGASSSINS